MSINKATKLIGIVAVLAMVLAACGEGAQTAAPQAAPSEQADSGDVQSSNEEQHEDDEADHEDGDEHEDDFVFGRPGDVSAADRVIEIGAKDDFTFSPAEITVAAGETITFEVTNTGKIPHDLTLGDQATQDAHEAEMASGDMKEHGDPNAVVLEPGETKELTWTFTEAGTVLIGCHQPGHYAAGMKGAIDVTS